MKTKSYPLFTLVIAILLSLSLFITAGCESEDDPLPPPEVFENTANINPANYPNGAGLDLNAETDGLLSQLDENTDMEWDIQIITYRTNQGGRPGIFLYGDSQTSGAVTGANVSALTNEFLGSSGFEAFVEITADMRNALQPDEPFTFNPRTDTTDDGRPDAAQLAAAYDELVIGDDVIRLDEADQPTFLITSREQILYKFQFAGLEGGGGIRVRWARMND